MSDTVAVLGTGRMGFNLARNFARAGRAVLVGSRDLARAADAVEDIRKEYPAASLTAAEYAEAARSAGIIVLAVPFAEGAGVLTGLGDALAGKVVVDITNPFGAVPPDTSGPETHARLLPPGASLVAAWKTNFWALLEGDPPPGAGNDVFLCGDDAPAKAKVSALIAETNFRPIDCGGLASGRALDLMVPLLIEIDSRTGNPYHSAWKFITKE